MATNKQLARINVRLEAEVAKYQRDLEKARKKTSTFGSKVRRTLLGVRGAFGSVLKSVFSLRTGLVAAGGAVGLGYFIKRNLDSIDALAKNARAIGLNVKQYQQYTHAASLAGIEQKSLDTGIRTLTANLADFERGTGLAKDALEKLGVSQEDIAGKDTDERLQVLADAFEGVTTATEKTALAYDIFGGRGTKFINLLKGGREALKANLDEATNLGLVLSGQASKGVEDANDSITRLKALLTGASRSFTAALAPAIDVVVTKFRTWLQETAKAEGGFSGLGAKLANNFIDASVKILSVFETLSNGVLNTFTDIQVAGRKIGLFPKEQESRLVNAARRVRDLRNEIGILQVDVDSADISGTFADHFEDVDVEATKQKINELSGLLKGANSEFYKLAELEGLAGVDPDKVLEPFKVSLLGIKQSLISSKIQVSDFVETDGGVDLGNENTDPLLAKKAEITGKELLRQKDLENDRKAFQQSLADKALQSEIQAELNGKDLEDLALFEQQKHELLDQITQERDALLLEVKVEKDELKLEENEAELEALTAEQDKLTEVIRAAQLKRIGLASDASKLEVQETQEKAGRIKAAEDALLGNVKSRLAEKLGIDKKYADQSLKITKTLFSKEGRLKLKKAIQDGFSAIQNAVASAPFPLNVPAIVTTTAQQAANVAGIAGISFDGGGFTGTGSRTGGVDGIGGIPAIVHPNEVVVDLTKPASGLTELRKRGALNVNVPSFNAPDLDVQAGTTSINIAQEITIHGGGNAESIKEMLQDSNEELTDLIDERISNRSSLDRRGLGERLTA